ncbi:autotransporter assembly complex protein TamA [Sphingobium sufflavum]|uniref:autotransporter assembly complex protein TamA n=1 Tax=Sphingobium sufflavum TaxID=1129547 RepID=UPI001F2C084F|nr:autotransporter assembly complex family protein [Sphingobium sufflavum]MCE7796598.1 autotransporter assembly complex protein TamA [Sphingobium sufflavum]
MNLQPPRLVMDGLVTGRQIGHSVGMDRRPSSSLRHPVSSVAPTTLVGAAMMLCVPFGAQAQAEAQPLITAPIVSDAASPVDSMMPLDDQLDSMPDIGLDWPDLGADDPAIETVSDAPLADLSSTPPFAEGAALPPLPVLTPEADEGARQAERLAAIDPTRPLRYAVQLKGIDAIADTLFRTRFDTLSELKKGEDDDANVAQVTRRARTDVELLDRLMRTRGYYNARVVYLLDAAAGGGQQRLDVTMDVTPRSLYRLTDVTVAGLSSQDPREARLRALFTVKAGDPADTDAILASTDALRGGLAEGGYPFAKVEEPVLHVDHDADNASLDLIVAAGGYRRYGTISVTGDPPFDAVHVTEIARFRPGDPYRHSEIVDLQRALVATGLVGSADVTPERAASADGVDLSVHLTKAPPRTIAGELGYGTGEGARAEISWSHRNLFPPEGALTLRGVVGTREQSASATFRRNNFKRRDRVLNGQLAFSNLKRDAYQATQVSLSASLERQTNIIFQKAWVWSLGTELILSDERDLYGASLIPRRRTYFIAAAPVSLTYDESDDLLDPTRGFRLGGRLSPELSLQDSTFGYVRAQVDASAYVPMSQRLTVAGRVRLGTIVGASSDRIAPTRRYYAGGGGSVRGYSYQAIGPRDLNNDPVGGRSLGEISLEARFRFGNANQFGIVPFIDAGTISSDPWPSITEMRVGAGLGVRYYSSFGPIRIDVGTPVNPQPGDSRIGVYVSLGQAF